MIEVVCSVGGFSRMALNTTAAAAMPVPAVTNCRNMMQLIWEK